MVIQGEVKFEVERGKKNNIEQKCTTPNVGIEPTITQLRFVHSTD